MNLQLHLAFRIAAVALSCLVVIAFFSLYQSHRSAEQNLRNVADSLTKQLAFQRLRIDSGIGQPNPFPDFALWKETGGQPGVCVAFAASDGSLSRSLCQGTRPAPADWPDWFEKLYRRIFDPGKASIRPVAVKGRLFGTLTVTASTDPELTAAWHKTLELMALSSATVSAVCLLVYLSLGRALRPAQTIVAGLKVLETGHMAYRLPTFELEEWRHIAAAVNQLAASQQQLLEERQDLVVKLIKLQEEERRYLARELHDEFGQCLAAINAATTAIKQTAALQCPPLIDDADRISRITNLMLNNIRDLLGRLRPAELDDLGLAASLKYLVSAWSGRSGGKTLYRLNTSGDTSTLTEAQAVALFRIAQECLTNIAKHAAARRVNIELAIGGGDAVLIVQDDGITTNLPYANRSGIGLLGMRERIGALNGRLKLAVAEPCGLIVETRLPLNTIKEANT